MAAILLALSSRGVTPGPPDPLALAVAFLAAVAGTSCVGWWAHRLEATRRRRALDALRAAVPVAGVH